MGMYMPSEFLYVLEDVLVCAGGGLQGPARVRLLAALGKILCGRRLLMV
jgi:hypothetical protein